MFLKIIEPYTEYLIVAAAALVVLIAAIFLLRLLGRTVAKRSGSRLEITDYYDIDKSRRLLIVRRDSVEHLIMIGGPRDIVIEGGILEQDVSLEPPKPIAKKASRQAVADETFDAEEADKAPRIFKPAQMAPRTGAEAGPNIRQFAPRAEPVLTTSSGGEKND